jgi:hypothetical protein
VPMPIAAPQRLSSLRPHRNDGLRPLPPSAILPLKSLSPSLQQSLSLRCSLSMPSFNRGFYSQATASAVVKHATRLPSAAVFDCDFTLWPTHAEFHSPCSSAPSLYPAVFPTLDALLDANVPIAIASRTPSPNVCHTWLSQCVHHLFLVPRVRDQQDVLLHRSNDVIFGGV